MIEGNRVIVIGGGPAGYTAGIYLARADLAPVIFEGERAGGQLMLTSVIENFPGIVEGTLGPDLMMRMRVQAEKFGAKLKMENVVEVDFRGEEKRVVTKEGEYRAEAVVVATGARAKMLGVGEEKYYGKGLSTCAVCDAAFFRERRVMVVGGGDAAMEDALALAKFAQSVNIVHRRSEFRASKIMQGRVLGNKKINVIWESEVVGVRGEGKIESVVLKSNNMTKETEMKIDGLFLAIGHEPESGLFKGKLELDEKGFVRTFDGQTKTSVEGVFAAGDVVDFRYKQAITAAGSGCQAGLDAERYLENR